ncbi:hypothetical protein BC629DRAFT_1498109 [Irpex lacteus]|nr:hypothetical protein BC629DRAFT_1498109 [Irpex lacteus]
MPYKRLILYRPPCHTMGDAFASAIESALAEGQHNAMLTRYFASMFFAFNYPYTVRANSHSLAVAGLSLMLWDYCLTIDQEVDLIWRAKNISLSRVVFRLSRYGLILSLLYANTVLTFLPKRMMSQEASYLTRKIDVYVSCKSFASILAFCVMMSALGTNCAYTLLLPITYSLITYSAYLIMRHLRAWDGRREIYWVIICAMGLTHIPGVVLAGISMKEMYRSTVYVAFLDTCAIFSKSPAVIPAWACVITFDSIVIVLSLLNNLDRPRRRDADIIVYLKRDGAPFFLVSLRYIGLVLLVKLPVRPPLNQGHHLANKPSPTGCSILPHDLVC